MSEEQDASWKQIDDKVVDTRNEMIMQATNAFLLGRQVVLVSLGLTALGVEQSQALLQQAVKRGEVVACDAQQCSTTCGANWQRDTTHISSRLAALLNKVPGVSIASQAPAAA